MRGSRKKKRDLNQAIAKERIRILFEIADREALSGDLETASSCVKKARTLAMKYTLRMPGEYRSRYCRYCHAYLLYGTNAKVRTNPRFKRVEIECFACKKKTFIPYVKELREKRRNRAENNAGKKIEVTNQNGV